MEKSTEITDPIIRDLEIMSDANNYRKWIYSQFSKYLGRRIIDLGAGIGNFTEIFLDRELIIAIDNYDPCIEYLKKRFSNNRNVIPLKADVSSPEMLGLSRYNPDTFVCIDILEHVRDDVTAISYMFNLLKTEGRVLLLVPALQFLYGSIDRMLGHQRRYNKNELSLKLTAAGFKIKEIFYMNSVAMIGWFLNNRISKRKEESPSQVLFFDRYVVPWLKVAERIVRPPLGLSLVAVGEK